MGTASGQLWFVALREGNRCRRVVVRDHLGTGGFVEDRVIQVVEGYDVKTLSAAVVNIGQSGSDGKFIVCSLS